MRHRLKLNVTNPDGEKKKILECGELTLPARIIRRLLGENWKILVVTPGSSVVDVVITELAEGGGSVEEC